MRRNIIKDQKEIYKTRSESKLKSGLVAIREKYNKYKTSLSKTISSNEEAKLAIETIDYFENNLIKEGVKHLRVSRFYKLLFLNRLVDRYK